jgi:Winged helix DNA-binding domain
MPRLSWAQVTAARLERHALAEPLTEGGPAQIAARMCGVHAQVIAAAQWSVGLRLAGSARADVHSALWADRSLVKTFGPRGTVHLLPAADLARWTGALSTLARPQGGAASSYLAPEQAESVLHAMDSALASAELTADELGEAVVSQCGSWAGDEVMPAFTGMWPRWRQALSLAGARGVLCFGADRGRKVTFASPQRWLGGFEPEPAASARAWLLTEYLTAYGPATADGLARWLSVPRPVAAALFAEHADGLRAVELAGTAAWWPAAAALPDGEPGGVRLLPYFDGFVVGGQPRQLLFPGRAAERALVGGKATGQAGTKPVLLVDGVVAGLWQQRRTGRALSVTVEAFGDLTRGQHRQLADQVERLGEFHGCPAVLTLGPVVTRSHL